jgi:protein-S-isoprenylcysteine O-methyltransferase Ste14
MSASPDIRFVMRIPPPLLFVLTFFAGVGMQRLAPLSINSTTLATAARLAGFGSIAAGMLLMLSSVGLFLETRTSIVPFGTASHLVSRGPYRFTRNPMYLGLVLVYIGVSGILFEVWPLILLPLPLLLIHRIVIPFEESRLREIFGDVFVTYCERVRRWI